MVTGASISDAGAQALADLATAAVTSAPAGIGNDFTVWIPDVPSVQPFIQYNCFSFAGDDYGDAPSSYGVAYHPAPSCTAYLGNTIDIETGMQHDANALGDDNGGVDDEDGVTFSTSTASPGEVVTITVAVNNDCNSR